jgi:FkbM family methyltransferase
MVVRRKALRLLVDSLPAQAATPTALPPTPWPREVDTRVADAFAASLIAAGGDRGRELAYTLATRVLSLRQQVLLRWRLATRVQLAYSQANVKLHVGSPDELTMAALAEREPWTARWIERYMAQGHVFYDIAANVGVFSLLAARLYGPPTRVWAFEPAFMNFESLCRNVIANGCEETVTPLPVAVMDRNHLATLDYPELYAPASAQLAVNDPGPDGPRRYRAAVVALALDDLVTTFRMAVPNHIRVGVNGQAATVLRGAPNTLADPRLLSLLIEIPSLDSTEQQVGQLLSPFGFRVVERHARTDPGPGGGAVILLYVRSE